MLSCSSCLAEISDFERLNPCVRCGSVARTLSVNVADTAATFREGITVKNYVGGAGAKETRLRYTIKSDIPGHRALDGLPTLESQIIDKKNDMYEHKITDEDGNVLHHEKHRLTEHQGRGSAKFKKPQ